MGRLQFLSLGAGVQSSTILLMSLHGDLPPLDAVAFADTGDEPSWVYETLAMLDAVCTAQNGPEIVRVSTGHLGTLMFEHGKPRPPFFIDRGTKREGMLWRKCTRNMKVTPLERYWKQALGLQRGRRLPKEPVCDIWLGISVDEMQRATCAKQPWLAHYYPLLEKRMRRQHCVAWLTDHGYPVPGKSACIYCPYRSNEVWQEMYEHFPETFAQAVWYDNELRRRSEHISQYPAYVHRSLKPLDTLPFLQDESPQQELFCPNCMT